MLPYAWRRATSSVPHERDWCHLDGRGRARRGKRGMENNLVTAFYGGAGGVGRTPAAALYALGVTHLLYLMVYLWRYQRQLN